jgi:hypothetical protein
MAYINVKGKDVPVGGCPDGRAEPVALTVRKVDPADLDALAVA